MKTMYLEHANITVNNIERAIDFFKNAFPDFNIRGKGIFNGRKWVHFGNNDTYLAINQSLEKVQLQKEYGSSGINHIGFVVGDVEEVATRLISAGFKRDYPKEIEEFRIRDYFADDDGNQFEFVEYLSDIPDERNQY
jgi:catechol 2,3-dioxygenase-like lactoylglutathione lyase family enzyme